MAFAIVGAGGALATRIHTLFDVPSWVPAAVALGCAGLGILYSSTQAPRPVGEIQTQLIRAIAAGLLTASVVFTLLRFAT